MKPAHPATALLAALLLWTAAVGCAPAQELEALMAGVVRVVSQPPEAPPRTGTGFVIKVERDLAYIATASHVIKDDPAPQVEFFQRRNRLVKAEVVRQQYDDDKGLALLLVRGAGGNLPEGLPALAFGASNEVRVGQDLWVIGFGQGQGDWGLIRAAVASFDGADFKLDGRIEEGNSGGPVIRNGKVVGLVTSVVRGFGIAKPSLIVEATMTGWGVAAADAPAGRTAEPEPQAPAEPPPQRAAPAERYLLTGGAVKAGRVVRENGQFEVRSGALNVNYGGLAMPPGTMALTYEQAASTEVLGVNAGRASKVRRTIDRMNWRLSRQFGGQRDDADIPSPLQGRSIVAEREGSAWRIIGGGAGLPATISDDIGALFDTDWGYPAEPVPVGHQWMLGGEQLARFLGLGGFAVSDGEASFQFEAIEDCAPGRCAAIEVRLRVSGTMVDDSGVPMQLALQGDGYVLRSLSDNIDREHRLSGDLQLQASTMEGGIPITMTVTGPFTLTGQASLK
jgi:hypothetical protein